MVMNVCGDWDNEGMYSANETSKDEPSHSAGVSVSKFDEHEASISKRYHMKIA